MLRDFQLQLPATFPQQRCTLEKLGMWNWRVWSSLSISGGTEVGVSFSFIQSKIVHYYSYLGGFDEVNKHISSFFHWFFRDDSGCNPRT